MSSFARKLEVWRLLSGAPDGMTLRELAAKLGVVKNTVQRDIDQLSAAGVPIQQDTQGQTVVFFLERGLPLPGGLTERERLAVAAGAVALRPYRQTPLHDAATAAVGKLGDGAGTAAFEDGAPSGAAGIRPGVFEAILQGILEQRRCELTYRALSADRERVHVVEPHRFLLHAGLLYLRSRVPPRRDPVLFALHRVLGVVMSEDRFTAPVLRQRHAFGVTEDRPERVRVRFHPDIAPYIAERRWHRTQRLRSESGGWLVLEARVAGMHEFVGWVMSWGDRAELVRPRAWRTEALRRAQGLVHSHREEGTVRRATRGAEIRGPR